MVSERRAFQRRLTRLPASLGIPGQGTLPVEIRDFSPGGFFLSYVSPLEPARAGSVEAQRGTLIEVRCKVPSPSGDRSLSIRGRLVRSGTQGIGVAFADSACEAFEILREFAGATEPSAHAGTPTEAGGVKEKTSRSGNATPATAAWRTGGSTQPLFLSCKQRAVDFARQLATDFLARAGDHLRSAADTMTVVRDRAGCYNAADVLAKHGDAFQRGFEAGARNALGQPRRAPRFAECTEDSFDPDTLSLVDQNEFEDWLAFSAIAREAEIAFHDELALLDERIRLLTGVRSAPRDNPFGPHFFCTAFQHALGDITLSRAARPALHALYRDVLCGDRTREAPLGRFYADLNAYLAGKGILPACTDVYDMVAGQAGASALARQAAAGGTRGASHAADHGPAPTAEAGHAAPPAAATGIAARPSEATGAPAGGFYSPAELVSALSRVRLPESVQADPPLAGDGTTVQFLSMLAQVATEQGQKPLARRESEILNVTGTLIDAMLEDRHLDDNVRTWLRQLSIPLLKVAIRDDSLFGDRAHLARQLVDNLARLEFDVKTQDSGRRNAVRRNIDRMLGEITSAEDVTAEALAKVVKRTQALLRLQSTTYRDNVDELTAVCEEFDQGLPAVPGAVQADGDASPLRPADGSDGDPLDALAVGDGLLLDTGSGPRRLKLAWITRDAQRFVFANGKGRKEATLTRAELAQRLKDGSALRIDASGDSLFDRAQQTALERMHLRLLHESSHDQLTGLVNRRAFTNRLAEVLAGGDPCAGAHVVCYVNLDRFSVVNHAFGYGAGDQLLVEVAGLLAGALGTHGLLARLGGDEFGILFSQSSVEKVLAILATQRDAVHAYRLARDGRTAAISFSAGVVALGNDDRDAATVMHTAEISCRAARRKGKSYVHVYDPADADLSRDAQIGKWATRIDDLIDKDQLWLRVQPIVCVTGACEGTVHHSEVLLGVCDEHGVPVSPTDFIRTAEQLRRSPAVDRWVIDHAFQWIAAHPDELPLVGGLAINLSGASMSEEGFARFILDKAQQYAVPMQRVGFEATETAAIANLATAVDLIVALRTAGATFALDDFGSGLSSYAYLKNLPVDFLKIDGAFVRNLHESPSDRAVVKSIAEIGHFMGKKVIAEAVESQAALDVLRNLGVDYAQGYALGMPRPL